MKRPCGVTPSARAESATADDEQSTASPFRRFDGDAGHLREYRPRGRDRYVEHLANDLCPAMEEIDPAVLDRELPQFFLAPRLVEENEFAAIVQIPRDATIRKDAGVGDWRARRIFAEPGRIDDERAGLQRRHRSVVELWPVGDDIVDRDRRTEVGVDPGEVIEARP